MKSSYFRTDVPRGKSSSESHWIYLYGDSHYGTFFSKEKTVTFWTHGKTDGVLIEIYGHIASQTIKWKQMDLAS